MGTGYFFCAQYAFWRTQLFPRKRKKMARAAISMRSLHLGKLKPLKEKVACPLFPKSSLPPFVLFSILFLAISLPLQAYIGPGAGFAFLTSFFILFLTFFLALFSFFSWPFRFLFRVIKGQRAYKKSSINRLIIIGLDGLEPTLVEKYISEEKLPNLAKLKQRGAYAKLQTTIPSISPVAWSSFMTGCNPSKHNIFDFLSRDPKTYLPRSFLGPHRKTKENSIFRKIQYSPLQARNQRSAQEHPFLENLGAERYFQHHPESSDNLSPRKIQRPSPLWNVYS